MIGFAKYVRCECCYGQMLGIVSPDARDTCHGCGGRSLIGEMPARQALVRRAKERLVNWEPPKPRSPGRPDGREAA
jgi:hypothetical protein